MADPIIIPIPGEVGIAAFCSMVEAIARLVEKAMDGQKPEQKAQLWQWWIEDQARWRKLFGLDKP